MAVVKVTGVSSRFNFQGDQYPSLVASQMTSDQNCTSAHVSLQTLVHVGVNSKGMRETNHPIFWPLFSFIWWRQRGITSVGLIMHHKRLQAGLPRPYVRFYMENYWGHWCYRMSLA